MDNLKTEIDIIEEVAGELGINKRIVENIVKSSIDFFHEETENNPKLLTFGFTHLATFQANLRMMLGKRRTNDVVKERYDKLIELDAKSRHVDLPLAWVLYRNHSKSVFDHDNEEGKKWYIPNLNWVYGRYYDWLEKAEEINNEKVAKFFK